MTLPSEIPFVHEAVQQEGSATWREQVLTCSAAGCDCALHMKVTSRPKPAGAIYNIARRRGWSVTKKGASCPTHNCKRHAAPTRTK